MRLDRRSFLGGLGASAVLNGCTSFSSWGKPKLTFGVLSDIHIITPESASEFVEALTYFRNRKVDAVMVCGDLTDWGLLSGLKYVAEAWNKVFPKNRAPDGRRVEKLFVSGNHDYEGWWYGDMTMEMHALGYSEDEALVKLGFKRCWEDVFQETWAPVRHRVVKGYSFISGEWHGHDKADGFNLTPAWFDGNAANLDPEKPIFYFQHPPIVNTTGDSLRKNGGTYPFMAVRQALAKHPNLVSFTGHCHWTFNDARSIWQDEFTAIATPSMSYTTIPAGYENAHDNRRGLSKCAMPVVPTRFNLEEAQGYLVSVYDDRLEIERRDFEQRYNVSPWIVPLPTKEVKPYAFKVSRARERVPEFPLGAELKLCTRNTESRRGHWIIAQQLEFPSAMSERTRAFDYEVRVVLEDGSVALMKQFVSPAFHKLPKNEPARQRFWFDVAELPQGKPYRLEVRPRNCFGDAGKPLVSTMRCGKPGLGKAVGEPHA